MSSTQLSRRTLLKAGAVVGAGLMVPGRWLADAPAAAALGSGRQRVRKFVQPLRGVGGAGIPVAQPGHHERRLVAAGRHALHHRHRSVYRPAAPRPPQPDPALGFRPGRELQAPRRDHRRQARRPGPDHLPQQPACAPHPTHRPDPHGRRRTRTTGRTSTCTAGSSLDQRRRAVRLVGPEGHRARASSTTRPAARQHVPANEAEYYYPNNQGTRLVWYHDHAFGLTRLNAYAGIASAYVIYDDYELSLVANNNLPGPLDPRTVYLVFQDKIFVSARHRVDRPDLVQAGARNRDQATCGTPTCTIQPVRDSVRAGRPTAGPFLRARVLRRHHPGQRARHPIPGSRAAAVPLPPAERLPGALPEPAPGLAQGNSSPTTEPNQIAGPGFRPDRHRGRLPAHPAMVNGAAAQPDQLLWRRPSGPT